MKLRNILAFAALAVMLVFTSCKDKKNETPDHLKVIPASSAVVMSIEAEQIVEKGGLDNYKDLNVYKYLSKEIQQYEPEGFKMLESFLSNTRSSGLNLDQVYMYTRELKDDNGTTPVFTFGVDNSTKFGNWLTSFVEKVKKDDEYKLEDKGEYKMFRIDYSSLLVWNNSVALLISGSTYELEAEGDLGEWLKVDEANSIITNADFMASYKRHKDVTTWMSFDKIVKLFGAEEQMMFNPMYDKFGLKEASFDISLNFTDEKAALSCSVWPETYMEKYMKEYPVIKTTFEQSLLNYFSDTTYVTGKLSINPSEYYKLMVENMRIAVDSLEAKYGADEEEYEEYSYYGGYGLYEYKKILAMIDNPKVDSIVNLFKGDLVGSIFGFESGAIPMPQFAIATTLNGEQAFNQLLAMVPKEVELKKEDSYYVVSAPEADGASFSLYIGFKGDVLYVTNKKQAITNFFAQGYKNNLASSVVGNELKNNPLYAHLNLNIDEYPGIITMGLRGLMGEDGYGILSDAVKSYRAYDISFDGKNTFEMCLVQRDTKNNSLKNIVKAIDKATGRFMGYSSK